MNETASEIIEDKIDVHKPRVSTVFEYITKHGKLFGTLAVIATVIIIISYIVFLNSYPWYEKSLSLILRSVEKGDEQLLTKAYPSFITVNINDRSSVKHSLARLETYFGDNVSIKYEITDKEKISSQNCKTIQAALSSSYNTDVKVTDGAKVNLKITFQGDVLSYSDTFSINTYRINGEWLTVPDEFKSFETFIINECNAMDMNFY